MKQPQRLSESGLSLIEIIIAIVMFAILAAMTAPYFGSSFTQSSLPIARLQASADLSRILENITASYNKIPHWRPNTSYASNTLILPSIRIRNGYQYKCTGSGTSGANEPLWPQTVGSSVADGSATWQNDGNAPTLVDLQTAVGAAGGGEDQDYSNAFGNYRVVQNRFIKFDAGYTEVNINNDPSDEKYQRYLKVTIGHRSDDPRRTGETRTALYVMR